MNFRGFAYVEANDKEEAEDRFATEDIEYEEYGIDSIEEVDDFIIEI